MIKSSWTLTTDAWSQPILFLRKTLDWLWAISCNSRESACLTCSIPCRYIILLCTLYCGKKTKWLQVTRMNGWININIKIIKRSWLLETRLPIWTTNYFRPCSHSLKSGPFSSIRVLSLCNVGICVYVCVNANANIIFARILYIYNRKTFALTFVQ